MDFMSGNLSNLSKKRHTNARYVGKNKTAKMKKVQWICEQLESHIEGNLIKPYEDEVMCLQGVSENHETLRVEIASEANVKT